MASPRRIDSRAAGLRRARLPLSLAFCALLAGACSSAGSGDAATPTDSSVAADATDTIVATDAVDATDAIDSSVAIDATSLSGTFSCGTLTCGSGQVCRVSYGGDVVTDDTGRPSSSTICVTVPSSCVLTDCSGPCSDNPCVRDLCGGAFVISLSGRMLMCGGA